MSEKFQDTNAIKLLPQELALYQEIVLSWTGISLNDSKKGLISGRLNKRLLKLGMKSYSEYISYIQKPQNLAEKQTFINLITTNETYFFREPIHFEMLRSRLQKMSNYDKISIWSAAASTGCEAWSIVIECLEALNSISQFDVVASDINFEVLERAKSGIYSANRLNTIPKEYLKKYFLKGIGDNDGFVCIDPQYLNLVTFETNNLIAPLADSRKFDIIFLRNVLIYFNEETKAFVLNKLASQLKPNGWLILGLAETLNNPPPTLTKLKSSIYVKKTAVI